MRKQWLVAAVALVAALPAMAQQKFNEWGWPTPYEQVSPKSVQWLKDKGWWPVSVAYQAPWSGQNTVNIVMDRQGMLKARGVTILSEPMDFDACNRRFAVFSDPWGNVFEVDRPIVPDGSQA